MNDRTLAANHWRNIRKEDSGIARTIWRTCRDMVQSETDPKLFREAWGKFGADAARDATIRHT